MIVLSKLFFIIYRLHNKIANVIRRNYVTNRMRGFYPPHIIGKVYVQTKTLKIGKNVTLYPGVYLWGNDIEIGDNVDIGIGTIIYSSKKIKIGSNTSIAGQCYIIDSNHSTKDGILIRNQQDEVAENGIEIGSDVWIAAQCSVLKGARIGDGAVIGAQSLVNSEIPPNGIAVGTPAKLIKYRS